MYINKESPLLNVEQYILKNSHPTVSLRLGGAYGGPNSEPGEFKGVDIG